MEYSVCLCQHKLSRALWDQGEVENTILLYDFSLELKPGFPEMCASYQKFQRNLRLVQNFVQGCPDLWSHIESSLNNAIGSEISTNMDE